MASPAFVAGDFKIFDVKGFKPRMTEIRARVRPKLDAFGDGMEEERAQGGPDPPEGEAPGVVQERARRRAGSAPRRPHAREARRARRRADPDARRSVRRRTRRAGRRGGALDGGAVPLRRARDLPRAGSPLPAPVGVETYAVLFDIDGVLVDSG